MAAALRRVCEALPTTPTNKILTRALVHDKFRFDRVGGDPLYMRARGAVSFRAFTPGEEESLRRGFEANGRNHAWEL